MKRFDQRKFLVPIAALIVVCVCTVAGGCVGIAEAGGMYGLLTDELVELYEREVAGGERVLTGKSPTYIALAAQTLGISVDKYRALTLVQDLQARVGDAMTMSELARLSDIRVMAVAKDAADKYLAAQTPERRQQLLDMVKSMF